MLVSINKARPLGLGVRLLLALLAAALPGLRACETAVAGRRAWLLSVPFGLLWGLGDMGAQSLPPSKPCYQAFTELKFRKSVQPEELCGSAL